MPDRGRQTPSPASRADRPARTASGCGRAGHGQPSQSPSRRSAAQPRGSSRTGRRLPEQSSAAQRLQPSLVRVPWPSAGRSGAPHRSHPHTRVRGVPRTTGSVSDVHVAALPRSQTEADRGCLASGQSSAEADLPARSETQSPRNGSPSLRPSGIPPTPGDRKSTRLNSSHTVISYAVFCLKKKKKETPNTDLPHQEKRQDPNEEP